MRRWYRIPKEDGGVLRVEVEGMEKKSKSLMSSKSKELSVGDILVVCEFQAFSLRICPGYRQYDK